MVVFGSGGGSWWDQFCGRKKCESYVAHFTLHCTSQSTIDMQVNLYLHLIFLCPKRVCSTHLTFTFLQVLNCLSVSSAVQPVVLGCQRCRLLWLQLFKTFTLKKNEKYLNSKNFDVTIIVKDRATGELDVKSQTPKTNRFLRHLTWAKSVPSNKGNLPFKYHRIVYCGSSQ